MGETWLDDPESLIQEMAVIQRKKEGLSDLEFDAKLTDLPSMIAAMLLKTTLFNITPPRDPEIREILFAFINDEQMNSLEKVSELLEGDAKLNLESKLRKMNVDERLYPAFVQTLLTEDGDGRFSKSEHIQPYEELKYATDKEKSAALKLIMAKRYASQLLMLSEAFKKLDALTLIDFVMES